MAIIPGNTGQPARIVDGMEGPTPGSAVPIPFGFTSPGQRPFSANDENLTMSVTVHGGFVIMNPTATRVVTLPTTEVYVGYSVEIVNISSLHSITVNASGGGLVATIAPDSSVKVFASVTTPTTPAQWKIPFSSTPTGIVSPFAGQTPPSGWLLCAGQAVSRTTYAALFAALGTVHGVGDGSTTFNLPDLRGRVVAGKDDMNGSAANRLTSAGSGVNGTTLGASGGSELLSAHSHGTGTLANATSAISGTANSGVSLVHAHTGTTGTTGSSHSHIVNQFGFSRSGSGTSTVSYDSAFPDGDGSFSGGEHTHTFTTNNSSTLDHSHSVSGTAAAQTISGSTASAGTGSHGVVQPTLVLNYIIKA